MAKFNEIEIVDDPRNLGPGWVPALLGLLGVLAIGALPYAWAADDCAEFGTANFEDAVHVPGQEAPKPARVCAGDLQGWVQGDPLPFSEHFDTRGVVPETAKAERVDAADGVEFSARMASQAQPDVKRSDEVEALLAGKGTPPVLVPETPLSAAALAERARQAVVEKEARLVRALKAAVTIPVEWYATCESLEPPVGCRLPEVLIDDPHGAMRPFYRSLLQTSYDTWNKKKTGHVTRISHWGDSAIVADGITSGLRRLLQRSFGDAGHGFMLIDGGKSYAHQDVRHSARGWSLIKIIHRADKLKRYGFGGISVKGYGGARATFATKEGAPVGERVSRFDVYYMKGPRKGRLELKVDSEAPRLLDTAAESPIDAVESIVVPDGAHKLRLRAKGSVRLYGVVMERDAPGVVYDSLGLLGARGSRLLDYNDAHLAAQFRFRQVDLMVLMFGGNGLHDRTSLATYRESFESLVKKFRQASPDSACLIMSPVDHAELYRRRYRTIPRLIAIIPIQREVAHAQGCAYFSAFDAMGGEGAMASWVKRDPPLAYVDYSHLRPAGGNVVGLRVYKAMLVGFAQYLKSL